MKRFILIALILISGPLLVHAQTPAPATSNTSSNSNNDTSFVSLTKIPVIEGAGNAATLPIFLNSIYKICVGLAAVLAVIQLIIAGISYMGGDSFTEKKEARNRIAMTFVGLLLVLAPTIIFGIINPDILNLKIGNLDKLQINKGPAPGSAPSNPTPSTIDATGAVNPACKLMPDGTQIRTAVGSQQNSDEQCCTRQKVNGIACTAEWNYRDIRNPYEYCSCSGK